jgi:uncharacterized membrane protein HdeD (DUF308 family)
MGKHHHASRAKVLLVIGVSLILAGLAVLILLPLEGTNGAPPNGPAAPPSTDAITGTITAVAGLITSIAGLITLFNARRTTRTH